MYVDFSVKNGQNVPIVYEGTSAPATAPYGALYFDQNNGIYWWNGTNWINIASLGPAYSFTDKAMLWGSGGGIYSSDVLYSYNNLYQYFSSLIVLPKYNNYAPTPYPLIFGSGIDASGCYLTIGQQLTFNAVSLYLSQNPDIALPTLNNYNVINSGRNFNIQAGFWKNLTGPDGPPPAGFTNASFYVTHQTNYGIFYPGTYDLVDFKLGNYNATNGAVSIWDASAVVTFTKISATQTVNNYVGGPTPTYTALDLQFATSGTWNRQGILLNKGASYFNFEADNFYIGATPGTNIPSAILACVLPSGSAAKGFLPPVLTYAQRNSIAFPAAGLMFYNSTANPASYDRVGLQIRTSGSWHAAVTTDLSTSKTEVGGTFRVSQNTPGTTCDLQIASGYQLTFVTNNTTNAPYITGSEAGNYIYFSILNSYKLGIYSTGIAVSDLSNSSINASAVADFQSTTRGVLLPRLTTTQINAISSPAAGLTVYNTTLTTLCFYNGTAWRKVNDAAM